MKNNLPQGWAWSTLGEVCSKPQYGWTSKSSSTGRIKYLRTTDITKDNIDWERVPYCELEPEDVDKYLIEEDDILVSRAGSVGVSYRVNKISVPTVFASYLIRFKPKGVHPKWIEYSLHTKEYWQSISEAAAGIAVQNVNAVKLANFEIPIPPLAEQGRIVAKLDEVMQRVEASQERLEKLPGLLKQFRQAVLAAAISGRLTESWRAEHPQQETGAVIVDRLRLQRNAQARTAKGKESLEETFNIVEEGNHFELPENWSFIALDKLALSFNYGTSAKSENSGEVPVLRMGNLQAGKLDWSDLKYTSDLEEIKQYSLSRGDVLFNRTNSPELVGKTSIYQGEQPAVFAGYLIRIKASDYLNPEYLNYCLNSSYARKFCWEVKTDGVSQSNINAQKLSRFEVPFCSLAEQEEIVRQVTHYFDLADQLEARFDQASAVVDQLSQALLAKAFGGQLVPQDFNDEPASVLLERMKIAAANSPAKEIRKVRTKTNNVVGNKQSRQKMKGKPVKTLPEFVERLTQLGGKVEPKQLMIEFDLQEDVDSFFELLRDGKAQGLLNVPTGVSGPVELA